MAEADRQKWNAKHLARGFADLDEDSPVKTWLNELPQAGRVLDVAGGSGRHALFFAERGFDCHLTDISSEALKIAEEEATNRSLTLICHELDLEQQALPRGPWSVIVCAYYLQRELFAAFKRELAENGRLVFVQPTKTNLERHQKPSAAYLLEPGELLSLLSAHRLRPLEYAECWQENGRHEAVALVCHA